MGSIQTWGYGWIRNGAFNGDRDRERRGAQLGDKPYFYITYIVSSYSCSSLVHLPHFTTDLLRLLYFPTSCVAIVLQNLLNRTIRPAIHATPMVHRREKIKTMCNRMFRSRVLSKPALPCILCVVITFSRRTTLFYTVGHLTKLGIIRRSDSAHG